MMRTPLLPALAVAALALAGCQKASDDAFGARVRSYLLAHPEVLQEMSVKLAEQEQLKKLAAVRGAIGKHRQALERDPRDFVANPGGRYTVVEFFDYNCGYCKLAAPEVVKLIQENPDVRFVFKEFAFQTRESIVAAKLALTPVGKARGVELYQALMSQKPLDGAAIERSLQAAGVDAAAAKSAGDSPAIAQQIAETHRLAGDIGIDGTPAFVVGDQLINGADIEGVRAAIQALRRGKGKPAAT